ncbi:unnamed protein product [Cunninghamella blakesleeana]
MLSPKMWKEMESHHQLLKEQQQQQQQQQQQTDDNDHNDVTIENTKLIEQPFHKHVLSPSKQFLDFKLQTDSLLPSIQEEMEPETPIVTTIINNNYEHGEKSKEKKSRPTSFHASTKNHLASIITTPTIPIDDHLNRANVKSDLSNQKRHTMCLPKKTMNQYVPSLDIPTKPIFTSNNSSSVKNDIVDNKHIKTLRFNVVQLASLTTEKDLDFELSILMNEKTIDTRNGQMKKLSKKMSSCMFSKNWIDIPIDTPFELTFMIKTKPARPHKVSDFFTRSGQWSLFKKGKGSSSIAPLPISNSIHTNNMKMDKKDIHHVDFSTLAPSGYVRIFSGEQFDLIKQGKYRYRFSKSLSSSSYSAHTKTIEAVIDFQWSHRTKMDSSSTPSSKGMDGPTSQLSKEYNSMILSESMSHTHQGDHLTFYFWGAGIPEWRRYWTVLENDKLLLKPFGSKKNEYMYTIPLKKLVRVSKPTDEDQENIYLSRQLGVVLQFDISKMKISERVELGKMYILTDNKTSAEVWRHALSNIKSTKSSNGIEVDNRFLW